MGRIRLQPGEWQDDWSSNESSPKCNAAGASCSVARFVMPGTAAASVDADHWPPLAPAYTHPSLRPVVAKAVGTAPIEPPAGFWDGEHVPGVCAAGASTGLSIDANPFQAIARPNRGL